MTTSIGEESLNQVNDNLEVMYGPLTEEQTIEQDSQRRHLQVCAELGKMAPKGSVVLDYDVIGWSGTCSPVNGDIHATISDELGVSQTVLHPTRSRHAIEDKTIFNDLNALAEQWRSARRTPSRSVDLDRR